MTRRWLTLPLCAIALALLSATPVAAAKPESFDFDDPQLEADDSATLTAECGFAATVDYSGHVIFHVDRSGRYIEVDDYQTKGTFTNVATGTTVSFHDSGPNRVSVTADGHVVIEITGRDHSGGAWVGVVTVDVTTGEVLSMHGHALDDVFDDLCERLAA
jgi:hypothetical protein